MAAGAALPPFPPVAGFDVIAVWAAAPAEVDAPPCLIALGRLRLADAAAGTMEEFRRVHVRCLPIDYDAQFYAACAAPESAVLTLAALAWRPPLSPAPVVVAVMSARLEWCADGPAGAAVTSEPPAAGGAAADAATGGGWLVWLRQTVSAASDGVVSALWHAVEALGLGGAAAAPGEAGDGGDEARSRALYVMTLAVLPEMRRQGCARRLLGLSFALARALSGVEGVASAGDVAVGVAGGGGLLAGAPDWPASADVAAARVMACTVAVVAMPIAAGADAAIRRWCGDGWALLPSRGDAAVAGDGAAWAPLPVSSVVLDVLASNDAAQALYAGVGFTIRRRLSSHYWLFGQWHDGLRLAAAVPDAGRPRRESGVPIGDGGVGAGSAEAVAVDLRVGGQ